MPTIYYTILIDLQNSRQNFKNQELVNQFIQFFAKQLNHHFADQLNAKFQQKDGDTIMLILQVGFEQQLFDIYQYCNNYYYHPKFVDYCDKMVKPGKQVNFYFSIGIGTITTKNKTDVNVANGSAIVRASEGMAICKAITAHQLNSSNYFDFKTAPFKLYINAGQANQMLANNLCSLYYLLYERILKTKLQRIIFPFRYPTRTKKNYEIAEILAYTYQLPNYQINYDDASEKAKASSRISLLTKRLDKEPIAMIEKLIVNSFKALSQAAQVQPWIQSY